MPPTAHKDAAVTGLAIPPHGASALFNTPGVSVPRWRRKRLKAPNYRARAGQVIAGNLARGGDGKFTSAGSASAATPKPATKKPTDARRAARAERQDAERATREEEVAAEAAKRDEEDSYIAEGATGKERQARRREVAAARRARAIERRQARAARQTEERERRAAEDAEETTADAEADAEKPKGGGKGGKPKPSDEEKRAQQRQERQQRAVATAAQIGQDASFIAGLTAAVEGTLGDNPTPRLSALGFVENGEATDGARRALAALERGDIRGYRAAVQDAQARMQRQQTSTTDREARIDLLANRARQGARLTQSQRDQLTLAGRAEEDASGWRLKSGLQVFKDAAGRDRWVAITTSAYEDRDEEIITTKGIAHIVAIGDATGKRGTLRYWHVPELDLGDCDFQAQTGPNGRWLIESGTFYSAKEARIGRAMAAAGWQMSPGFVHGDQEPYIVTIGQRQFGLFDAPVLFERSPTPPNRASNYFGLFTAKEYAMNEEKRAALKELTGGDEQLLADLLQRIDRRDAAAQTVGLATKEAPAWAQDLVVAVTDIGTRLKALETKAPMPPAEMIAAGETEATDGMAEESADDATEDDVELEAEFVGDMSPDAFKAILREAFAEAITTFGGDISMKLAEMDNALKGMGYARAKSDDGIAALTTATQAIDTRLKALEGDQPRSVTNGVMRQIGGVTITTEQAKTLKQSPATNGHAPANLNDAESAAYRLLFGNE